MVKGVAAVAQRVLVGAKVGQAQRKEVLQERQRLLPRDGVAEVVDAPRTRQRRHLGLHPARQRIGFEAQVRRRGGVARQGTAVFLVEVPGAAGRLVAVQQHPEMAAHVAVEILQ